MSRRQWTVLAPMAVGGAAAVLLAALVTVWGLRAELSGAVIARGALEVENNAQVIQHPDGGVVAEILARDGDEITAGDPLMRLDGTYIRSQLATVEDQLLELRARRLRLVAERDGHAAMDDDLLPDADFSVAGGAAAHLDGQRALFEVRRATRAREVAQLREQQRQIGQQIDGIRSERRAVEAQLGLVAEELRDAEALFERGLAQVARVREMRRAQAELSGRIGSLDARAAEARTRISSLEIELLRQEDARREAAITTLQDLAVTERDLAEQRALLVERLSRMTIVAPVSGTVFGSRVFAERAVVQAAEPVMYLVPGDQPLHVAARIDPLDVDQVHAGQDAVVVLSAFDRSRAPEVAGKVRFVSATAARDELTGASYYAARIEITENAGLARLPGQGEPMQVTGDTDERLPLVPGMPVEAFLRTGDRTPVSYLVQPLTGYFARAFRGG